MIALTRAVRAIALLPCLAAGVAGCVGARPEAARTGLSAEALAAIPLALDPSPVDEPDAVEVPRRARAARGIDPVVALARRPIATASPARATSAAAPEPPGPPVTTLSAGPSREPQVDDILARVAQTRAQQERNAALAQGQNARSDAIARRAMRSICTSCGD